MKITNLESDALDRVIVLLEALASRDADDDGAGHENLGKDLAALKRIQKKAINEPKAVKLLDTASHDAHEFLKRLMDATPAEAIDSLTNNGMTVLNDLGAALGLPQEEE